MKLKPPRREEMPKIHQERLKVRNILRTPHLQTLEEQQRFYESITDPKSPHRYYSLYDERPAKLVGFGGLTNIDWVNRRTEISLIIFALEQRKLFGTIAVKLLIEEAFDHLNLHSVYGECYACNPSTPFWEKIIQEYNADTVIIPSTKYLEGKYYDSLFFTIIKEHI